MGVNIWINKGQVYLDIYSQGGRRRERLEGLKMVGDRVTDKETMRLAGIAKAKRAQQVFAGEWGLTDPIAGKQTLYRYIEKCRDSEKTGKSAREGMASALVHLKAFPEGRIAIAGVNEDWIERFQEYLLSRVARSSAGIYAAVVRTALNRAVREKIILKSPAKNVKRIKAPESDRVWLNADELKALADTPLESRAADVIRRAFIFACYTGLRISDMATLAWGDIEHSPLQVVKRMEKTEEKVYVPLAAAAWAVINDGTIHDHRALVFPGLEAHHSCYDRLNKWAKAAGIQKRVGWHTARHTFAVLSLEAGAEIYTLSKLLGHTSIKTTEVYAKATDKMKRAAVDALPAVELKG
jgi:integrase